MIFQIKYYQIVNKQNKLIGVMPMKLTLNKFNEEVYDSGWNEITIDGEKVMAGGQLDKNTMMGSFRMASSIKYKETVFDAYFKLVYFRRTCFTFWFHNNVYVSVVVERADNE